MDKLGECEIQKRQTKTSLELGYEVYKMAKVCVTVSYKD